MNVDELLDQLADEFEQNWGSGNPPQVSDFLVRVDESLRPRLLELLIPLDTDYRQQRGEVVSASKYSNLGPRYRSVIDQILQNSVTLLQPTLENSEQPETAASNYSDSSDVSSHRSPHQESQKSIFDSDVSNSIGLNWIGPYCLVERLGAGGMGEVWVAEQSEPVKRRVALKLIKSGIDSKEILARFDLERQALARMDHPNVARILDAGQTDQGNPFFVMELVTGLPLTQYCDENRLGIEQRLELFVQVCAGVQHAHQKGIIHRDLKPGNIIVGTVDDKPVPKVIDFGLAKAMDSTQRLTDQSLFTGIGQILGTLKYMSPEQASLDSVDIDTRTDIYALGIILYELLTGTTPLDDSSLKGQAALKVLEMIREKEAVKPSSKLSSSTEQQKSSMVGARRTDSYRLNRILAGDLDWIVMKSIDKDRKRRYESVSGFAADIGRYLNSEPVIARPPSFNYRLQKFVRKNRVAVISGMLVALALVGGIVGISLGLIEARRQNLIAQQQTAVAQEETRQKEIALVNEAAQRKESERQRELAEQAKQQAETNLSFAKKGNRILSSVFSNLDPTNEFLTLAELRNALRDNLGEALIELDGAAVGTPLEVANLQRQLGLSLLGLGEFEEAAKVFNKVLEIRSSELGEGHPRTLQSLNDLAVGFRKAGNFDAALPLLEKARNQSMVQYGPESPETLLQLNNLAAGYNAVGKFEQAQQILENLLPTQQRILGVDHHETVTSMVNLASCYHSLSRIDSAIELQKQAFEIVLEKHGENHPDTLKSKMNLGGYFQASGKTQLAIEMLEQAFASLQIRYGFDHTETLTCGGNLAVVYRSAGELKKALEIDEQVFEQQKIRLGLHHPRTLIGMNNLAQTYDALGQSGRAQQLLEQALNLMTLHLGEDHPDRLVTMTNLAMSYHSSGLYDRAIPMLEKTLLSMKEKFGLNHRSTMTIMNNLSESYRASGQVEKALTMIEQTLEAQIEQLGPNHPNTIVTRSNYALTLTSAGKLEKAIEVNLESVESMKQTFGDDHQFTLTTLNNLAGSYHKVGRYAEAIEIREVVLEKFQQQLGPDHPSVITVSSSLITDYWESNQQAESLKLAQTIKHSLERQQFKHPLVHAIVSKIVAVSVGQGHWELAESTQRQWIEIVKTKHGSDSFEYAEELSWLGTINFKKEDFDSAANQLEIAFQIMQQLQPDDWKTFITQSWLGAAKAKQQQFEQAERLLIEAYEALVDRQDTIPTDANLKIVQSLDRLIELYNDWKKPEQAEKYQALRETRIEDI